MLNLYPMVYFVNVVVNFHLTMTKK